MTNLSNSTPLKKEYSPCPKCGKQPRLFTIRGSDDGVGGPDEKMAECCGVKQHEYWWNRYVNGVKE